MKKNRMSMNLIMVLAMAAVAVCVLVCAIVIFVQTYRSALIRNAETTSRQAIAQVSSTMEEYLDDMNGSVALLTEYLDLPVRQREARFEAFLEIKPDVVAITTYDENGQMKNCYSLGQRLREHILQNLSLDASRLDEYADGYVSAPHHRRPEPMGRRDADQHQRAGADGARGRLEPPGEDRPDARLLLSGL